MENKLYKDPMIEDLLKRQHLDKPADDFTASIMQQIETETKPFPKMVSYDLNDLLYILLALGVTIISLFIYLAPRLQIFELPKLNGTRWMIISQFFQTAFTIVQQFFENIQISPLAIAIILATLAIVLVDRLIRRREFSKSFMIL